MGPFLKLVTLCLLATSVTAAPLKVTPTLTKRSSSSSSKRGAAYNTASLVSALSTSSAQISWAYNWGSAVDGDIPSGVEYVPMLWGADSIDGWTSAVKKAIKNGSTYILGFNEPDMSSQADMSASDAATYYKKYITPYADDATLVSPAVSSSSTSGEGLDWLESFLTDCDDCSVSAIAVHWYGSSLSDFKTFVNEAIDTAADYDISEVWITEFGLSTDESGISDLSTTATFVQEASDWLDEQSEVTRYAFFYCANDYMLTDGVANSVGEAYAKGLTQVNALITARISGFLEKSIRLQRVHPDRPGKYLISQQRLIFIFDRVPLSPNHAGGNCSRGLRANTEEEFLEVDLRRTVHVHGGIEVLALDCKELCIWVFFPDGPNADIDVPKETERKFGRHNIE
ncbi:hypothetical protein N7462_009965 [Penicillium macrosclerotiorum]|uniref:uncharacterized protein n=1 Tax=Penicillium macrosclerotiorum TaxID=303699 RepID=UPI0025488A14|nr:uncharacterized protein N7462_009965 [Penicillium macrosclerotiorum]KAJ5668895.1 hypothetical protein N7462_009965 [Penicillium macrosclerotiorum]